MGKKIIAEDLLGFFNGLGEVILDRSRQFQNLLGTNGCEEEVEEFKGLVHGYLEETNRFVEGVNRIEGKAGHRITPTEPIEIDTDEKPVMTPEVPVMTPEVPVIAKKEEVMNKIKEIVAKKIVNKRNAQISGEEYKEENLDKQLESDEKMKYGETYQLTPSLERKETVGSTYDSSFLAEECMRLVAGGAGQIGTGIYPTIQDAFTELIAKDKNLNKKQIEDTKIILAEMGFKVK